MVRHNLNSTVNEQQFKQDKIRNPEIYYMRKFEKINEYTISLGLFSECKMNQVCITIHITTSYWTPFGQEWNKGLTFLAGQLELSTENQMTHWQMYAEGSKWSLNQWKKELKCKWVHIEERKGSQEDALKYVRKEESRLHGPDTYFEYGTLRGTKRGLQGSGSPYKRALEATGYDDAIRILKEAVPRDFVLFNNQITGTLRKEFAKGFTKSPDLSFTLEFVGRQLMESLAIVLSGPTGIGKTQYAIYHFEHPLICSHIDDLKKLNTGKLRVVKQIYIYNCLCVNV